MSNTRTSPAPTKPFGVRRPRQAVRPGRPNGDLRKDHQHEAELKLILSSNLHDWNVSENFIAEKNLGHDPWSSVTPSPPPARCARRKTGRECTFCAQKFMAGAEAYGGLGNTWALTLAIPRTILPGNWLAVAQGYRLSFSPPSASPPPASTAYTGWVLPTSSNRLATGSITPRKAVNNAPAPSPHLNSVRRLACNCCLQYPLGVRPRQRPRPREPARRPAGCRSRRSLIYRDHCLKCHKADAMGDGHKRPPLRSERIRTATDGDIEWFLRQGDLGHGMPSWSSLPRHSAGSS